MAAHGRGVQENRLDAREGKHANTAEQAEKNAKTIRKLKKQVMEARSPEPQQPRSAVNLAIERNGHVHFRGRAMSGNGVVRIRNGRVVNVKM